MVTYKGYYWVLKARRVCCTYKWSVLWIVFRDRNWGWRIQTPISWETPSDQTAKVTKPSSRKQDSIYTYSTLDAVHQCAHLQIYSCKYIIYIYIHKIYIIFKTDQKRISIYIYIAYTPYTPNFNIHITKCMCMCEYIPAYSKEAVGSTPIAASWITGTLPSQVMVVIMTIGSSCNFTSTTKYQ